MKKLTAMLFAVFALAACSASSEDSTGDNAPAVEQNDTQSTGEQHTWPCTENSGTCRAAGSCPGEEFPKGKIECGRGVCCLN